MEVTEEPGRNLVESQMWLGDFGCGSAEVLEGCDVECDSSLCQENAGRVSAPFPCCRDLGGDGFDCGSLKLVRNGYAQLLGWEMCWGER
jgi:hypothetical protein